HLPECNLQPKWRNDKVESNGVLPVSRTNLALALDVKPYQRFLRMSNSAQGKLLDYTILNDVQWRSSIYDANVKINNDASIGSRTCFSMESIDLTKESGTKQKTKESTDDRLKFLGEAKRIELFDEAPSPVAIWKQRVSYVCVCVCVWRLVLKYDRILSLTLGDRIRKDEQAYFHSSNNKTFITITNH
ncbi:unnamed protein product, partial [Brugia timori]|uniref:SHR-BD domain-containing protein n=1 Tax=Brugia timori TaxID=42155 RepID=A0A0R3QYF8_9BILA